MNIEPKAFITKIKMNKPFVQSFLFVEEEHNSYWLSEGKVVVSCNGTNYSFDLLASYDDGSSLYFDEENFFVFTGEEEMGEKGYWRLYDGSKNKTLDHIPGLYEEETKELKKEIFQRVIPFLDKFEQEILQMEASQKIPIIDNVVVEKQEEEHYLFTFSIQEEKGTFQLSMYFDYYPEWSFVWKSKSITKDNVSIEYVSVNYHHHIFEQCKEIIQKYDQTWRIRMTMLPHETVIQCPLFKKAEYEIQKKVIRFE